MCLHLLSELGSLNFDLGILFPDHYLLPDAFSLSTTPQTDNGELFAGRQMRGGLSGDDALAHRPCSDNIYVSLLCENLSKSYLTCRNLTAKMGPSFAETISWSCRLVSLVAMTQS